MKTYTITEEQLKSVMKLDDIARLVAAGLPAAYTTTPWGSLQQAADALAWLIFLDPDTAEGVLQQVDHQDLPDLLEGKHTRRTIDGRDFEIWPLWSAGSWEVRLVEPDVLLTHNESLDTEPTDQDIRDLFEDLCCRTCGALNDDGEGWDGECGNCADRTFIREEEAPA